MKFKENIFKIVFYLCIEWSVMCAKTKKSKPKNDPDCPKSTKLLFSALTKPNNLHQKCNSDHMETTFIAHEEERSLKMNDLIELNKEQQKDVKRKIKMCDLDDSCLMLGGTIKKEPLSEKEAISKISIDKNKTVKPKEKTKGSRNFNAKDKKNKVQETLFENIILKGIKSGKVAKKRVLFKPNSVKDKIVKIQKGKTFTANDEIILIPQKKPVFKNSIRKGKTALKKKTLSTAFTEKSEEKLLVSKEETKVKTSTELGVDIIIPKSKKKPNRTCHVDDHDNSSKKSEKQKLIKTDIGCEAMNNDQKKKEKEKKPFKLRIKLTGKRKKLPNNDRKKSEQLKPSVSVDKSRKRKISNICNDKSKRHKFLDEETSKDKNTDNHNDNSCVNIKEEEILDDFISLQPKKKSKKKKKQFISGKWANGSYLMKKSVKRKDRSSKETNLNSDNILKDEILDGCEDDLNNINSLKCDSLSEATEEHIERKSNESDKHEEGSTIKDFGYALAENNELDKHEDNSCVNIKEEEILDEFISLQPKKKSKKKKKQFKSGKWANGSYLMKKSVKRKNRSIKETNSNSHKMPKDKILDSCEDDLNNINSLKCDSLSEATEEHIERKSNESDKHEEGSTIKDFGYALAENNELDKHEDISCVNIKEEEILDESISLQPKKKSKKKKKQFKPSRWANGFYLRKKSVKRKNRSSKETNSNSHKMPKDKILDSCEDDLNNINSLKCNSLSEAKEEQIERESNESDKHEEVSTIKDFGDALAENNESNKYKEGSTVEDLGHILTESTENKSHELFIIGGCDLFGKNDNTCVPVCYITDNEDSHSRSNSQKDHKKYYTELSKSQNEGCEIKADLELEDNSQQPGFDRDDLLDDNFFADCEYNEHSVDEAIKFIQGYSIDSDLPKESNSAQNKGILSFENTDFHPQTNDTLFSEGFGIHREDEIARMTDCSILGNDMFNSENFIGNDFAGCSTEVQSTEGYETTIGFSSNCDSQAFSDSSIEPLNNVSNDSYIKLTDNFEDCRKLLDEHGLEEEDFESLKQLGQEITI